MKFPRPRLHVETLVAGVSLFLILSCNTLFWQSLQQKALEGAPSSDPFFFLAVGAALWGIQTALLLLICNRYTVKPVLIVLLLVSALAAYFMGRYNVYLDKAMMRNLIETDVAEAHDLIQWNMLPLLVGAGLLPALLVARTTLVKLRWHHALGVRLVAVAVLLVLGVSALWSVMDRMAPLMRNHKEIRYLITPGNVLVSTARALNAHTQTQVRPRAPVATDAQHTPGARPRALIWVVGETVRAANWGLNGYSRPTTPQLAQRQGVINFPDMRSCGTDTATSLPCMFSLLGRRNYDEDAIRNSDGVLHIAARAGVSVRWLDNQSGCKGACNDLPTEDLAHGQDPVLCPEGRCFDAVLFKDLKARIEAQPGDFILVLHQMGNHGPAYFERYPNAHRVFTPTCDHNRINTCSREALVNTYDNAVHYTDELLAQAIDTLQTLTSHDTALVYVSDHGESLGERNMYLHGLPWSIAPDEQTRVPMVWWMSPSWQRRAGLSPACLQKVAQQAVTHDHLAHTLLPLMGVRTQALDPALNLLAAGCSAAP